MKFIGNNLLKFTSNFTVIDLETTGRSNKYQDVTEISAVKYRNGVKVDAFSTLIKAQHSIIPFVVGLTGITNDMIANAPKIEAVIEQVVDFIGDDIIVGHNVEFDYALIYTAYLDHCKHKMSNDYVDTLRVSRILNKDILNHKLETLCAYFDVERVVGHRALDDCLQTAQVYLKMYRKYALMQKEKEQQEGFYERLRLGQDNL